MGVFHVLLNCTNGTKSIKASHISPQIKQKQNIATYSPKVLLLISKYRRLFSFSIESGIARRSKIKNPENEVTKTKLDNEKKLNQGKQGNLIISSCRGNLIISSCRGNLIISIKRAVIKNDQKISALNRDIYFLEKLYSYFQKLRTYITSRSSLKHSEIYSIK